MAEAAVRLVRHVGYANAGTVEFIYDLDTQRFYFLEVNTRIQVEHPVTEMITGFDLVAEQILVAGGASLSTIQSEVFSNGHAIEFRINAENPEFEFTPSPGRLIEWSPPSGPGIRVDTHCYEGYSIPPFYDSLIAKVIIHANNRAAAIANALVALEKFKISGIHTTIPFHLAVLGHPDFVQGHVTTRWVEEKFMKERSPAVIAAQ